MYIKQKNGYFIHVCLIQHILSMFYINVTTVTLLRYVTFISAIVCHIIIAIVPTYKDSWRFLSPTHGHLLHSQRRFLHEAYLHKKSCFIVIAYGKIIWNRCIRTAHIIVAESFTKSVRLSQNLLKIQKKKKHFAAPVNRTSIDMYQGMAKPLEIDSLSSARFSLVRWLYDFDRNFLAGIVA